MTGDLVPVAGSSPVPAPGPGYTDRDFQLSDGATDRIRLSASDNTLRAYRRWVPVYEEFCADDGRVPYPGTPATLAEFVSTLCDAGTGPPSIKVAVAAVRAQHAMLGLEGHPATRPAMRVLRRYTRDEALDTARGQAKPILLPELETLLATCGGDNYHGRRDRLVLVLGFAGFFRRSELAAMEARHVKMATDGVDVFVPKSKTDQDAKGATVHVPAGDKPDTDVVRNLAAYRQAAAAAGVQGGRLFRHIGRGDRIADDITGHDINDLVQAAVARAVDAGALADGEGFSAHSLRSGGATWAYLSRKPIADIINQGRWAPNSPVVMSYIRNADRRRNNAMRNVGM